MYGLLTTKTCCVLRYAQVDAKTLRAELVPITSAALERIKLLLLNMARQATLAVLDDITARIQQLSARPTQLDDFVGYMVSLPGVFEESGNGRGPAAAQLCHAKLIREGKCGQRGDATIPQAAAPCSCLQQHRRS